MPGLDRSGPEGRGPLTGWRRGMCRRTDSEGTVGFDRGFCRGLGRGLGLRRGFGGGENANRQEAESGTELASLKKQYQAAVEMLDAMSERIALLEARK